MLVTMYCVRVVNAGLGFILFSFFYILFSYFILYIGKGYCCRLKTLELVKRINLV